MHRESYKFCYGIAIVSGWWVNSILICKQNIRAGVYAYIVMFAVLTGVLVKLQWKKHNRKAWLNYYYNLFGKNKQSW